MLVFTNPGSIDPRLITTLGVNVKADDSAIGFFGTGLKYAIAVTLRLGGSILIANGPGRLCKFRTHRDEIRGKMFDFIEMSMNENPWQTLGFTTELGKTWEPWQAYRELFCNARDEGGGVVEIASGELQEFQPGHVTIVVNCSELEVAHRTRSEFILETPPIARNPLCSIHPGEAKAIFYRGIKVLELEKPTLYTYNIQSRVDLTEDRTAKYSWEVLNRVRDVIPQLDNAEVIHHALVAKDTYQEHTFDYSGCSPSTTFIEITKTLIQNRAFNVNRSAKDMIAAMERQSNMPTQVEPTGLEREIILRAIDFLRDSGLAPDIERYRIKLYSSLGEDVLGCTEGHDIHISRRVMRMGTKMVAGTVWEEYIHIIHGHADQTRAMQNHLIDWAVTLAEEKLGRPL
jgi:hypothetical protein